MVPKVQLNLPPMPLDSVGGTHASPPKTVGDWQALVWRALGRCGLSQKAAASDLCITEQALSKQLKGLEHLSFWRMRALPPAFWAELIALIVDYHGLTLGESPQQRQDAEIGKLVREAVLRAVAR